MLLPPSGMEVVVDAAEPTGLTIEAELERVASRVSAEERLSQAQVDRIVALLDPRQPLPRLAQATPNG